MSKLTEKQRRFVEFFMGEAKGNASQAAKLAGYKGSDNTLRAIASENLTKPNIQKAIFDRISGSPEVADRERLQRFWTGTLDDGNQSMRDRLRASELLARTHGMFIDQIDIQVKENVDQELEAFLDMIEKKVDPQVYDQILDTAADHFKKLDNSSNSTPEKLDNDSSKTDKGA